MPQWQFATLNESLTICPIGSVLLVISHFAILQGNRDSIGDKDRDRAEQDEHAHSLQTK